MLKTPVSALLGSESLQSIMRDFTTIWMKLWVCSALWSVLFVYPPLKSAFPLPACLSPSTLYPSPSLLFMLAPQSGNPWQRKLPDTQVACRPCPASSLLFWRVQPQAITLTLCHSPSLNLSLFSTLQKSVLHATPRSLSPALTPAPSCCQMLASVTLSSDRPPPTPTERFPCTPHLLCPPFPIQK